MKKNDWWKTATRDEVEAYQGKQLNWFLTNRLVPFASHYRKTFAELNIDPKSIKTVDDLQRLPFTQKRMFDNPREFVMIPDEKVLKKQKSTLLKVLKHGPKGVKEVLDRELRPIFMTSTTGRSSEPVPFTYTQHDIANLEESGRRISWLAQAKKDYRMVNAFPFAPHLAFWQGHYTSIGQNMFTLSTGGGKTMGTDGNCRIISKINPDVVIAMPTFMYHLMQHGAKSGLKWDNLKTLVMGGEKVPSGMREKLANLAKSVGSPDVNVVSTYGFTEAKLVFVECVTGNHQEQSGYHLYPDKCIVEVIDPETGERVPDNTKGEIVFTALDARGTSVLRYRTGDLIEDGITWEKCPYCGCTAPRLMGKISRVSDIKRLNINKLKGNLVDFNQLEHLLDDNMGLGAWQIEIRKRDNDPMAPDELVVHAVPMSDTNQEDLSDSIRRHMREQTEISPNEITFHTWPEMRALQGVGKELKEQKVVDKRPV